ncbi:large cysteine-rich periplasmic protein omcB, partial [Chlamydia psittaci C1/97]
TLLILKDL